MSNPSRKSNAMKYRAESSNLEQFIEKCSTTNVKRKSKAMYMVHKKVASTGKPVCTPYGLHNPPKLDLTNYNKAKKEGKI